MFKAVTGHPEMMRKEALSHLFLGDARLSAEALAPFRGQVQCVYLDPPFLTGGEFKMQMRVGDEGMANGKPRVLLPAYSDRFESTGAYYAQMREILEAAVSLLKPDGTLFLHVDPRTSARFRILLDEMMGEHAFCNEIIWAYQTGGRSMKKFPSKHDVILMYRKSPDSFFSLEQVAISRKEHRRNHMKCSVDEEGRTYRTIKTNGRVYTYYDDAPAYPTDVWTDISHIQQRDPQRTGYDTQKPQKLLERIIGCSTRPGDLVADLCCGSGTTLTAAAALGRRFIGMDPSPAAMAAARKRLVEQPVLIHWDAREHGGALDAHLEHALGFYEITLKGFTLCEIDEMSLVKEPKGFTLGPLDAVDQWAAGLVKEGSFYPYAHGARNPLQPALPATLEVPMLTGTPALEIIDVMCRRHLFVWE